MFIYTFKEKMPSWSSLNYTDKAIVSTVGLRKQYLSQLSYALSLLITIYYVSIPISARADPNTATHFVKIRMNREFYRFHTGFYLLIEQEMLHILEITHLPIRIYISLDFFFTQSLWCLVQNCFLSPIHYLILIFLGDKLYERQYRRTCDRRTFIQ